MLSIDALRELVQHMEWADATVWRSVLAHEGARKDPRLRDLLTHLHLVQRLFLMVWRNEPLLPIEKKLIVWSLSLGIVLLVVLMLISRAFVH